MIFFQMHHKLLSALGPVDFTFLYYVNEIASYDYKFTLSTTVAQLTKIVFISSTSVSHTSLISTIIALFCFTQDFILRYSTFLHELRLYW